jgi:MFS family permease
MNHIRSRPLGILIVSSSLFILSQFYRAAVAVIAPELITDLSLDTEGLGFMSAAFFYGFAFTQIPMAIFLDRIGPKKTILVLNFVAVVGAVTFSMADSLTTAIAGRFLLGVGMACNLMGTFLLISYWFESARFATLTALVISLGTFGNIIATTPLVLLAKAFGWRNSFLLFAGLNLFLAGIFFFVVQDHPLNGFRAGSAQTGSNRLKDIFSGLKTLFKHGDYWIISISALCRYGIYAAIQTLYAGPFLMKTNGFSAVVAGNIILLMNIGVIIGGPVSGFISDRLVKTRKWIIIPGLGGMTLATLVLALMPTQSGYLVISATFFFLGVASSTGGIMYTQIKEQMPPEITGTAITGINFFNMVGPAAFLSGLSVFMQRTYPLDSLGADAFQSVFLICSAFLGAAAVFYLWTNDTKAPKRM